MIEEAGIYCDRRSMAKEWLSGYDAKDMPNGSIDSGSDRRGSRNVRVLKYAG